MFIILEKFNHEHIYVLNDEHGKTIYFDTEEDAKLFERENVQFGQIVKVGENYQLSK